MNLAIMFSNIKKDKKYVCDCLQQMITNNLKYMNFKY